MQFNHEVLQHFDELITDISHHNGPKYADPKTLIESQIRANITQKGASSEGKFKNHIFIIKIERYRKNKEINK